MKLIAIEDIIVGQIWENKNDNSLSFVEGLKDELAFTLLYIQIFDKSDNKLKLNTNIDVFNFRKDNILIGMDNITHKLENNKLVEIPINPKVKIKDFKLDIDDVVQLSYNCKVYGWNKKENTHIAVVEDIIKYSDTAEIKIRMSDGTLHDMSSFIAHNFQDTDVLIKKIGIYGVTHEFVNDKLIKE
jgi:hypothetical protein